MSFCLPNILCIQIGKYLRGDILEGRGRREKREERREERREI